MGKPIAIQLIYEREKFMNELEACPVCHEDDAYIDTEGGWCIFVRCANCGTQTASAPYNNEEERVKAEADVVKLWNMGKVIAQSRGE